MVRYLIAVAGLCAVSWLALSYTGYVIVRDETGLADEARVRSVEWQQNLADLPFGYFVAIPEIEGEVEVECSDGSKVSGGYVATHWKETVKVNGAGTCADMVQL